MALPSNVLEQVITYNEGMLAYLQNLNCFVATMNTKFKDFNKENEANLGDTVSWDLPPRSRTKRSLVVSFQGAEQRKHTLTVDQAFSAAHAFTAQQFIFNVEDYLDKFGKARVEEISAEIESNIALNATSSVPVMEIDSNGDSVPTGALYTNSGPFRFFGDGTTSINSFNQLATMLARYRNFGAAAGAPKVYLPDLVVPDIIGNGLNQFVPTRNEELAQSWNLGTYKGSNAEFYQSNLLPIHTAGTVGEEGRTLTVVSISNPSSSSDNYSDITFTDTTATDAESIKSGDLLYFLDGVSGQTNIRYLTWTGHKPSANAVQVRAIADATTAGNSITVRVYPKLISTPGINQNLNTPVNAGMQVKAVPSHRAGLIVGGDAFFLGMPKLPDESPYVTGTTVDPDTGVSLRTYYGSQFGQNQRGMVTDCIMNSTLIPEYGMRIVFPLTQAG